MGILDFFSREAGQERRRALDSLLSQFIPPTARPQFNLLGELNPVVAMERAGQDAQRIGATQGWERVGATGDMLSNMAGVVAPALALRGAGRPVAQAVEEGLLGFSTAPQGLALGDFVADESGALRLWHGSPHDFDRFSMDKIGTGEGAQAYGHGLYFAESPDVARNYRDNLSGNAFGVPFVSQDVRGWLDSAGGNYQEAAKEARAFLREYGDQMGADELASLREAIRLMDKGRQSWGRLYEVEVAADPADFLDWDAPLSAQPQRVRDALGPRIDALRQAGAGIPQDPIGEALWRVAHPQGGFDKTDFSRSVPEQATERLRSAGIPGIRYLDAGSRGAGDGSRNYVVFDENLITIVRKYGIAGAAAMLGMSQADLAQAMERQQQSQPMGLLNMGAR